jgi:hypothetical protein
VNAVWESVQTGPPAGVMPWGKHKGKPLNEVPRDYLVWAIENAEIMKPDLRREIETFLGLPIGSTGPPPSKPGDVKLNDIKANETLTEDEKSIIKQMKTAWGKDQARLKELEKENRELRAELEAVKKNTPTDSDVFRRIVKQAFAAMSRRFHPDMGGSQEKQTVVNLCFRDLLSRLETTP